ncbi:MAG: serine/threonine protein kinase [Oceanospirillaceae bacterium]|nr:serine/threonine protein kinase [Oceanospirillaceae bacterium]
MNKSQPFYTMTPDLVIDAVESQGWLSDYRILELNSYENRVYQVGIEGEQPVIAKFYRPNRWSDAQIQEEHDLCFELVEQELSVVAPLRDNEGRSLFEHGDFRFALYPRRGGRAPELDDMDHLFTLGQTLGRIHAVGASRPFVVRPKLDVQSFGWDNREFLLQNFLPQSLREAYERISEDLLRQVEERFSAYSDLKSIRVHGDCHVGNILWRDDLPHFVDFDDARTAPAIQDLWMLLTGDRPQRELQLAEVLAGYEEFYEFDPRELHLIEPLRALRMINYAGWLAKRYEDPAFTKAFPWFNSERYWGEHLLDLKVQFAQLDETVLRIL